MRSFIAGVLLLIAGTQVHAVQPESGWWWNEAQSGRGYTVEVQNNYLFFAGYLYAANGTATWYVAQGTYDHTQSRFSAPLLAFAGGQCLTCPYVAPTQQPSPGSVTLTFSSPVNGSLVWPGGTVPITRIIYGTTNDYRRLAGQWVYTSTVLSLSSSDWINFNQTTVSNGQTFMVGTNQAGRTVVANLASSTQFAALIDSSTSYYDFFVFPVTNAGVESLTNGREWLYLKTSSPVGTGQPGMAFKYGPAPTSLTNAPMPNADKVGGMIDALRNAIRTTDLERMP